MRQIFPHTHAHTESKWHFETVPAIGPEALSTKEAWLYRQSPYVLSFGMPCGIFNRFALLEPIGDGYRNLQDTLLPIMSQMSIKPAVLPRLPLADGYPAGAPLDLLYVDGAESAVPSLEWRERLLHLF
jgi:hypothetical protein